MKIHYKSIIQNITIFLLFLVGVKNILISLPLNLRVSHKMVLFFDKYLLIHTYVAHKMLSFVLGILMIFLVYRLYRRVRMAWVIEIVILLLSISLQIVRNKTFLLPQTLFESAILLVLFFSYKSFSRRADKITLKKALVISLASFGIVIINSAVTLFLIRKQIHGVKTILDAFLQSFNLLFFMDTSEIVFKSRIGFVYVDALITLNWVCIFSSFALIMKPLILHDSKLEKGKVQKIVLAHGQNPMSYLSLEKDKKYYKSKTLEGIAAYTCVADVFVCCGDMICKKEDGEAFLKEISGFCNQNGWNIMFLNITDFFLEEYKNANFGVIKYGEDACFKLDEYNLAGGKSAKVRASVNRANRDGVTVFEYTPKIARDEELEKSFNAISNEWLKDKNTPELSFMLGGLGLSDPMDRRYFYAKDVNCDVIGFVVFIPYLQKKGYLADVTRYKKGDNKGVLEKIIYEAFMVMKAEGVEWGNMGLSPLYNVGKDEEAAFSEKLFSFVYDNLNEEYSFQALHSAKLKYGPTEWQNRYVAFNPSPFKPQYAYAIVKAQNPKKLSSMLLSKLKQEAKINKK